MSQNPPPPSNFYPRSNQPSPAYEEFIRVRTKLLDVIRQDSNKKEQVVTDLVDSLLEHDLKFSSNFVNLLNNVALVGRTYRLRRKKRELYRRVVVSLLEKIFDPDLEFKMAHREIQDVFEANDIDRGGIRCNQISAIYVKVKDSLESGNLRDMIVEIGLITYVQLKLREIELSRMKWEGN